MIKILIVEYNAVVRKGLADLLNSEQDFTIEGTAANGRQALELLINGLKPDIILTDLTMHDMDGIELTRALLDSEYTVRIIILTIHQQLSFIDKALAAGAMGYLFKGEDFWDLLMGIRAVHSGKIYVSGRLPI